VLQAISISIGDMKAFWKQTGSSIVMNSASKIVT
jgi:hypothetical protein